jgi:PAS domain S-box-containing protein
MKTGLERQARDAPLPDGVPVGLYRSTPDGRILACNDSFAEILGYEAAKLLALSSRQLFQDEDDYARLTALVAQRGTVRNYETRVVRGDGHPLWVELSLRAVSDAAGTFYEGALADVTERKVAEDSLWDSERRLRVLVNQMPAVLWSTDRELRFTLSLGARLQALGLQPNEVVGRSLADFLGTDDPSDPFMAAHQRCLHGSSVSFEASFGGLTFQCYVEPLRDPAGTLAGVLGVALDVSERRRAEQVVRQAEARYRQLVESVKAVVWRGDPASLRFSFVSAEAEALLGYPVERWTVEPDFWLNHVHPEDRARALGRRSEATADLRPHDLEYRMIAADGRSVWLHDVVRLMVDEGRARENVSLMIDITERKRHQAVATALYRLGERASVASSMSALFSEIHAIVRELMPARNFYIALHDATRNLIEFPYFVDEVDPRPRPKPPGRGLTEYVLRSGEPFLATPAAFRELQARGEVELIGAQSVDWLGVPLKTSGRTIGVVVVQSYAESLRYTEADRELLAIVSQQIARVIERTQAAEEIQRSVSLLQSTLESTGDGIVAVDLDGRVTSLNQRVLLLWRLAPALAAERSAAALWSQMAPQCRDPERFLESGLEIEADPERESFDLVALRDGRVLERRSIPQRLDGRAIGRVWSFREPTRRRPSRPR